MGVCQCGTGLTQVGNRCAIRFPGVPLQLLNETCAADTECEQVFAMECRDNMCQCSAAKGFRLPTRDEYYLQPALTYSLECRFTESTLDAVNKDVCDSVVTVKIEDECCDELTKCPDNASPDNSTCDNLLRCRCDVGYAPNSQNTACIPLVEVGQNCSDTVGKCRGSPTEVRCDATTSQCICGQDQEVSSSAGRFSWCVLQSFPDLGAGLLYANLGETCSESYTFGMSYIVCHRLYEQECKNSVCTCRAGFREATEFEILDEYMNARQCRPVDKDNDTRVEWVDPCTAPLVDQEVISNKERLLFFQKGLPVLAAGLVVAIIIVIGLVVYRRRKRLRAKARQDEVSLASFGSSGGSVRSLDDNNVLRRVGLFRADRSWTNPNQHFSPTTHSSL